MTVRFDDAWAAAQALANDVADAGLDVIVVRDLLGRVSLVIDDRPTGIDEDTVRTWGDRLAEAAGPFVSQTPAILASTLFQADQLLYAADRRIVHRPGNDGGTLALLERGVVGAEWNRIEPNPAGNRVTLYGFKGGVGRSTATFMLAQHLASLGRCVLVVDLDLESPGVSTLLQRDWDLPDHGLVDHLVESAVGNEAGLELVTRSRLVEVPGNGEVWLAGAGGRPRSGYDYLSKLNRAYADLPADDADSPTRTLGYRLRSAVTQCESSVSKLSRPPDVTLVDSRAGIHDVAAVAMTQLSDLCLLFAIDSAPTWAGYRTLFAQWGLDSELAREIRQRLRMVASLVPSYIEESEYLRRFRDHAQACFADTLYDDLSADANNLDAFNPAPDDEDAPHAPLPILFNSDLIGLDATNRPDWSRSDLVLAAYAEFVEGAAGLILGDEP